MWEMKTLKDLVIIKAFVPEKIPKFVGTESMFDFVIWNLYDRIANGLKSFDLLCDNRRFYDAFLVAGNVLETCAVLSYIKDKQTEKERLGHLNKYLARSSAGQMVKILSWLCLLFSGDYECSVYGLGMCRLFSIHVSKSALRYRMRLPQRTKGIVFLP